MIKRLCLLSKIFSSRKEEVDYFRGDALQPIHQINRTLGKKYSKEYGREHEYLAFLQKSIGKDEGWLMEPGGNH